MGSSKKHKDDKERTSTSDKSEHREKSHKSEHREKSSGKNRHKTKNEGSPERRDKKRKVDDRDDIAFSENNSKKSRQDNLETDAQEMAANDRADGASSNSQGGDMSLSIAETNKLREKLGLTPLQLDDKPKTREVESSDGSKTMENVYTKEGVEFVHKPAANSAQAKQEEKLREKLSAVKEKRKIQEKLGSVKLLSTSDGDDSAMSWVERSRKLADGKKLAEQRAKIFEAMDQDFGISDIMQDQAQAKKARAYASKDLKGLTIQHSLENIPEGSEMILVLQDKDVLDNDTEEVLINPTLNLHEQWTRNAELKKKKPGYDPFQDDFDDDGNFVEKKLLGKYDEEIEGEQKESFKIGAKGVIDADAYKEAISRKLKFAQLREGYQNLESTPAQLATEFFTKDEMAKFKKPKKRVKKMRKRGGALSTIDEDDNGFKADDLINDVPTSTNEDFGSRYRGKGRIRQEYEIIEKEEPREKVREVDLCRLHLEADDGETTEPEDYDDLTGVVIEDEAENELQSILQRSRILKQLEEGPKIKPEPNAVADIVMKHIKTELVGDEDGASESQIPSDEVPFNSSIVLNAVSEYCRGLGDIPTYGLAGNRDDVDPSDMYYQQNSKIKPDYTGDDSDQDTIPSLSDDEDFGGKRKASGKWVKAKFRSDDKGRSPSRERSSDREDSETRPPILEDEPSAASGVVAALQLAKQKGYLDLQEPDDHGPSPLAHLEAKRFTIIDKQFHDIDDKYAKKLERMGGHSGPISEFKEKNNYLPNIKLEYADKKGNLMDTKEAFRYMSWKFHGKCPGKKKTERRLNKTSERCLMNQMSSTDTPLGTLSKQIDKQKQLSLPYIVLSGAGSKDVGTSIRKD